MSELTDARVREQLTEEEQVIWDNATLFQKRKDNIGRWAYQYCEMARALAACRIKSKAIMEILKRYKVLVDKVDDSEFFATTEEWRQEALLIGDEVTALLKEEK